MKGNPKEAITQLGHQLSLALEGTGLAFVLVISEFNDAGETCYASNAQREGALDALEGLVASLREAIDGKKSDAYV